jgi:hypothetical protein
MAGTIPGLGNIRTNQSMIGIGAVVSGRKAEAIRE